MPGSGGEFCGADTGAAREEIGERKHPRRRVALHRDDRVQHWQICAAQRAGRRPRELGAKLAKGAEKRATAERVQRHEDAGTAMFERPAEFAGRRERTDRGANRADFRRTERGDQPFDAVGDE